MQKANKKPQEGLALLMFTALLTDSMIRPFGMENAALPARLAIFVNLVQTLILTLLLILLCSRKPSVPGRLALMILVLDLMLSSALEIIQAQRFYAYVMERKLESGLFLLLVFGAALYGAASGMEALERTAGLIVILAAASAGVMILSVWPQLRFSNLQTAPVRMTELWQQIGRQFYFPPELILFALLRRQNTQTFSGTRKLAALFGINCLMILVGEMTLGTAYSHQNQPIYTIARLGGVSVFRRLDALHVGIWLLLFLLKISFYFSAAVHFTNNILSPKKTESSSKMLIAAGTLTALLAIWNQREETALLVQQILLLLAFLCVVLHRKERKS